MNIDIQKDKVEPNQRTVYVHDYGDNYHRLDIDPSSELEAAARQIRRRYRKMGDYMKAVAVYNEYMASLYEKYGGKYFFDLRYEDELIEDFVPAAPRMKNTPRNKTLLKRRIVVSDIDISKIDEDKLEELVNEYSEQTDLKELLIDERDKPDKEVKKIINGISFGPAKQKITQVDSLDYLDAYFKSKNKIMAEKKEENISKLTLSDIIDGNYEIEDTDEDEVASVYYNGKYIRKNLADDLQLYNQLGKMGWDHIKLMKRKGVSNRVTKLAIKEEKRKRKRGKDKRNRKKENDDLLMESIFDNGGDYSSFGEFQKELEDMSAENVFNRKW